MDKKMGEKGAKEEKKEKQKKEKGKKEKGEEKEGIKKIIRLRRPMMYPQECNAVQCNHLFH